LVGWLVGCWLVCWLDAGWCLVGRLAGWPGGSWLVPGWLAGWQVGWLVGWLAGWLAGWLVGWSPLVGWLRVGIPGAQQRPVSGQRALSQRAPDPI
jgi:hypothetical protein